MEVVIFVGCGIIDTDNEQQPPLTGRSFPPRKVFMTNMTKEESLKLQLKIFSSKEKRLAKIVYSVAQDLQDIERTGVLSVKDVYEMLVQLLLDGAISRDDLYLHVLRLKNLECTELEYPENITRDTSELLSIDGCFTAARYLVNGTEPGSDDGKEEIFSEENVDELTKTTK